MAKMMINARTFARRLLNVLDKEGISVEEVANRADVSKATIYRIINGSTQSVQRSVARKIAEAVNKDFEIKGDEFYFVEPDEDDHKMELEYLKEDERELLKKLAEAPPTVRETIFKMMKALFSSS